jgi:hypothetical protein
MKIQIIRAAIAFAFVLGTASFIQAQSAERYKVHIPFDFIVGTKRFEAGNYSVEIRGFEGKYLFLRNAKGDRSYAIMPFPAGNLSSGDKARLDFWRSGSEYALAAIRTRSLAANVPAPASGSPVAKNASGRKKTTLALSARD